MDFMSVVLGLSADCFIMHLEIYGCVTFFYPVYSLAEHFRKPIAWLMKMLNVRLYKQI